MPGSHISGAFLSTCASAHRAIVPAPPSVLPVMPAAPASVVTTPVGGNPADGVVLRVSDVDISRAVRSHARRDVEPGGGPGAICAANCYRSARKRCHDARGRGLADRVVECVRDVNIACAVNRHAFRAADPLGGAGAARRGHGARATAVSRRRPSAGRTIRNRPAFPTPPPTANRRCRVHRADTSRADRCYRRRR